jgi:hypothetical protein
MEEVAVEVAEPRAGKAAIREARASDAGKARTGADRGKARAAAHSTDMHGTEAAHAMHSAATEATAAHSAAAETAAAVPTTTEAAATTASATGESR